MERPFLKVERVMTGVSTASMLSPMFSTSTEEPASMARSMAVTIVSEPMRSTVRLFFDSRSLIQTTPCSWGSIMSVQRSELVRIVPFCTDVGSEGRPWRTQPATIASSTSTFSGSVSPGVIGMFLSLMYLPHSLMRSARNLEVKGPA